MMETCFCKFLQRHIVFSLTTMQHRRFHVIRNSSLAMYRRHTPRQRLLGQCYQTKDISSSTHMSKGDFENDATNDSSVRGVIQSWSRRLSLHGVPEPKISVDLIVAHVLGKKMIHEVDTNKTPTDKEMRRIERLCNKRLNRVPVQYIIGQWDFHDMILDMKQPVLIPRPETEELAAMVVSDWSVEDGKRSMLLEIGCGTGAISLYILKNLPQMSGVALDKNETACTLTQTNAACHKLQDRIHVLHGDIFSESTISDLSHCGPYDILVSNPPYVTSEEMDNLEPEVVRHEDHDALHGGSDGLDIVRQILTISHKLLKPKHSIIWLEVGLQHPEKIRRMVEEHPEYKLSFIQTLKDFSKRERFCKLQLTG